MAPAPNCHARYYVTVAEGRREREMLRYTVRDAAAILGVTTGAVRNRLSRGTLQSVKEHGTVYVLLPPTRIGIPYGIPETYRVSLVH